MPQPITTFSQYLTSLLGQKVNLFLDSSIPNYMGTSIYYTIEQVFSDFIIVNAVNKQNIFTKLAIPITSIICIWT